MSKNSNKRTPPSTRRRMARRTMLQTKNNTTVHDCNKKICDLMLIPIVQKLYSEKMSHPNHKLPHNAIQNVYNQYKVHFPCLTLEMLKGRLKRLHRFNKQCNVEPTPNPTPTIKNITTSNPTSINNHNISTTKSSASASSSSYTNPSITSETVATSAPAPTQVAKKT
jgi:hypothetical protein